MIILVIMIILVVVIATLIWYLTKPQIAPTGSGNNQTTTTTVGSNTAKPTPTLDEQLPGTSSSSAGTAGWPAMTADFVKNLTYTSPTEWTTVNGWQDVPLRFTLSQAISRFEAGWYLLPDTRERIIVNLTVFLKDEAIATGDIDGDGLADAVAIMKWSDGSTTAYPLIFTVFGNQPYAPVQNPDVIGPIVGGNYSAQKITLTYGTMNLELLYPQAGDANCCWTGQANITLRLVNGLWQL